MLNQANKFSFIICDDDPEDQNMIVDAIKAIDITIEYTSVYNGIQLIDLLSNKGVYRNNREAQADAVILDINMPVMDGLSALTEIKNNDLLKEVPIFILNTSRGEDHTLRCRDLGVAGIYIKPCTDVELKTILKEMYTICGGKPVGKKTQDIFTI